MTVTEYMRAHGLSRYRVYKGIRNGDIPARKVGRRWVIEEPAAAGGSSAMTDHNQWPVSNVALAFPVGMPSDVALLGLCDIPADVPIDGPGLALSMVVFQIHDANGVRLSQETSLPHEGKVQCVFGRKDLLPLWSRLNPGASLRVRVTAWPRFYVINDRGGAELDGDDRGYHAGAKVQSKFYTLSVNAANEFLIDGKAEPKPVDPGPTAEEQAAMDAHDAQMAKERAEHEARERQIKEDAARENRLAEQEAEKARIEAQEADRQAREDAKHRREQQRREAEEEAQRAAVEREKLGIKGPGDVSNALNDPPSEDGNYLALVNLWEGRYAPHDVDGFKAQLSDIRGMAGMAEAVDEVLKRLGG